MEFEEREHSAIAYLPYLGWKSKERAAVTMASIAPYTGCERERDLGTEILTGEYGFFKRELLLKHRYTDWEGPIRRELGSRARCTKRELNYVTALATKLNTEL